jgi:hypothetical protein
LDTHGFLALGRAGVAARPDALAIDAMRLDFARNGFVKLPGLISTSLLAPICDAIELGQFDLRVYADAGAGLYQTSGAGFGALSFMTNCPEFLSIVAEIVGVGHIGCFKGEVLRGHHALAGFDEWHYDSAPTQVGALSINVSSTPYRGGDLELRAIGASLATRVPNHNIGDAVLFTVAEGFEHRITPVKDGTRTSFSGWFRTEPDYFDVVRHKALRAPDRVSDTLA